MLQLLPFLVNCDLFAIFVYLIVLVIVVVEPDLVGGQALGVFGLKRLILGQLLRSAGYPFLIFVRKFHFIYFISPNILS